MLKDILKFSNGKVLDCHEIFVGEFYIEILNDNDQEVYFERSDGYWCKSEYDEKGNQVYFENSDGYWSKSEYDENGNEVYYEKSEGFWFKREYDEKGNGVYYESSNGVIRDNRPKTQELTIEEIQSKLGFKVKVIEGK